MRRLIRRSGAPVLIHESATHIQKLDTLRKGIVMQGHHADCARTYSAFLTRKLRLHAAHPEFEGNLAVDTYLLYANRTQPSTEDLIR